MEREGSSGTEATALENRATRMPFAGAPKKPGRFSKRRPGGERWVKPVMVAEVEFAEWTPEGQVRHASFVGLRTDKPAKSVTREPTGKPPSDET